MTRNKTQQIRLEKGNKYQCVYCLDWFIKQGNNLGWDHFIPSSRGGKNIPENKLVACTTCNRIKSNYIFKSVEDARKFIKSFLAGKERPDLPKPGYRFKKIYHKRKKSSSFWRWRDSDGWEIVQVKEKGMRNPTNREQKILDQFGL